MGNKKKEQQEILDAMLRVNHAGEYGAGRIYAGQLAVLKNTKYEKTIKHMEEQELEHLKYFEKVLPEHRVRPSALLPLWHIGGYALGFVTALMGPRAAMACTVAVEEVIDEHYASQEKFLTGELKDKVKKFRAEENEHKETALENDAENAPGYALISSAIRALSKTAIYIAKRI